jgi:hypothetical protein
MKIFKKLAFAGTVLLFSANYLSSIANGTVDIASALVNWQKMSSTTTQIWVMSERQ